FLRLDNIDARALGGAVNHAMRLQKPNTILTDSKAVANGSTPPGEAIGIRVDGGRVMIRNSFVNAQGNLFPRAVGIETKPGQNNRRAPITVSHSEISGHVELSAGAVDPTTGQGSIIFSYFNTLGGEIAAGEPVPVFLGPVFCRASVSGGFFVSDGCGGSSSATDSGNEKTGLTTSPTGNDE
ncbi:MAG: hypothetical protein AAF497_15070, partial [Planctomycetota bacterium]